VTVFYVTRPGNVAKCIALGYHVGAQTYDLTWIHHDWKALRNVKSHQSGLSTAGFEGTRWGTPPALKGLPSPWMARQLPNREAVAPHSKNGNPGFIPKQLHSHLSD
jgi:hypothetical protein